MIYQKIYKREKENWRQNLPFYIFGERSIFKRYLNQIVLNTFLIKEGRIMDVGCATGQFLNLLNSKIKKYGIDFCPDFIYYANKHYRGIKFIISSAEKIPYPDKFFTGLVFKGTLHHLKGQGILKNSLQETDRLLKKGGKIYIHDRCHSFLGKIIHHFTIYLRSLFIKLKKEQATSASDNEPEFGVDDLAYLWKLKKYKIIRQKYILNVIFFLAICFTNTIQYLLGFTIAETIRYLLFPLVFISEKLLAIKNFTVEELLILEKP